MRFQEIEVSGIENIVFNRKTRWILIDEKTWQKYVPPATNEEQENQPIRSHDEMMAIVNALKKDRRYRMWIHYDTLNIVRRGNRTEKLPPCCVDALREMRTSTMRTSTGM